MSLNNIQLHNSQLADFFGSNLVITDANLPDEGVTKFELSTKGIAGKNKKKFVWLVNEPSHPLLADDEFGFLGDILAACKMNMDDIVLMNYAHHPKKWDDIVTEFEPKIIISSAVPSLQLPVTTEEYKPVNYNHVQFLFTESLQLIRKEKASKGKLWAALKELLNL
jgi:hypothetical protein